MPDIEVKLGVSQGPAGPPGLTEVDVVAVMQKAMTLDFNGDLVVDKDGDVVFSGVSQ